MSIRSGAANLARLGFAGVGAAIALTALVIALQILWALLGYYVGNGVSVIFRPDLQDQSPDVRDIPDLLRWDIFSRTYVQASLAAVALSHLFARGETLRRFITVVFAAPGAIYGFFGLVGGALNGVLLVVGANDDVGPQGVAYMFALGVAGLSYVGATTKAIASAGLVREVWRPHASR